MQLVYRIICTSIAATAASTNGSTNVDDGGGDTVDSHSPPVLQNDGKDNIAYVTAVFANNQDLINSSAENDDAKSNVSPVKRSDITTIVALREFLVQGIGGRILEVLLCVDTKNMLCARELTSLLVNLFPTNPWSGDPNNIVAIKEVMGDFQQLDDAIELLEAVRSKPVRLSYLEKWFVLNKFVKNIFMVFGSPINVFFLQNKLFTNYSVQKQ